MWLYRQTIFLLLMLGLALATKGQVNSLGFERLDSEAGLSQNLVSSIVQDKRGFLWFGTDEGLNRFDGNEFKTFRHEENNPSSINGNSIPALLVANDSTIWIGTNNGVCRYYPDKEKFVQYPVDFTDITKLNGNGVSTIKQDADGSIWITYLGSGIDVIFPDKKEILHYTIHRNDEYTLKNDYVTTILFIPDGTKMLGTRAGIQFIGSNGYIINDQQVKQRYPWSDKIDQSIKCFSLSSDGHTLWIGTELNGLYLVDLKTNIVENFNTTNSTLAFNNNIPSIMEDSKGNLWVGSEAIYLFDKKNKALIPYNELGVRGNVAIKNPILSLYEDKDNNIWIGTFRLGVLKYNPLNVQMMHYHTGQNDASLKNNQILSFNQDTKGNIWVGTDGGGLFKMQSNHNGFDQAPLNSSFSSQVIKCIFRDSLGYFWLGTWDGGMMKYHPVLQTLEIFNPDKKNFKSRHVWDIKSDRIGNLWVGTLRDGLCYFSPKTKNYSYYKNDPNDLSSLVDDDVFSLLIDSDNNLWVGTAHGISIFNTVDKRFLNLTKTDLFSLKVAILNIFEDSNKNIWLGTNGRGIAIINKKDYSIEKMITEEEGLPSNAICSIQPDNSGYNWVSTYNGLVKINRNDLAITEIPRIVGLQGKEFINKSNFKTTDGMLLFGGVNGFNFFDPDSLKFNPSQIKIVFTTFKIHSIELRPGVPYEGREILSKSITLTDKIYLSYKDYSITVNFASLSYNWQKSLRYTYFLENFDKEWQYTTSDRRLVHYTNLPPGDYELKVKASFDGAHWPDSASSLKIHISAPWWATWWFRTAVIFVFSSFLFSVYRFRVRFLHRQKEKLEVLVINRTENLKKANAELSIRNSEVEIQKKEIQGLLFDVDEKKNDIEEKNHELHQINEVLALQRDNLNIKSQDLEKAQTILKQTNLNLEGIVDKRTEKLNHTLRELETFLYRASHDLRGPLATMLGLIHLEKMESQNKDPKNKSTQYFEKTVLKLERTLQKITQRYTLQKAKIRIELFNKEILLSLIASIPLDVPSFRTADLNLTIDDNMKFESDRDMLLILLSNLLENAFYFSEQALNKAVSLKINQLPNQIQIVVMDYGAGISPEIKDKIFSMFFRGNENSTGNGLGLYLVKNAINKLNGEITFETEVGIYTKFTVVLNARFS